MITKEATLYIANEKKGIPSLLFPLIHQSLKSALSKSSQFYIALSGGSLPSLLNDLPESFQSAGINPNWEKWHVILADERIVPLTDDDSNMKACKESFLDQVPIPKTQIYGINESLIGSDVSKIASEYQSRIFPPSCKSLDQHHVDCVLLGFGPDGHTASLFPHHELLHENELLVAGIMNSPKPPPQRITLTMKVFNDMSQDIIFVGAGDGKAPILDGIFSSIQEVKKDEGSRQCIVRMNKDNETYPCGMIFPRKEGARLMYITDEDGAKDLSKKMVKTSVL
jgi:6-phosphogluconolactonase